MSMHFGFFNNRLRFVILLILERKIVELWELVNTCQHNCANLKLSL